ncbi:MAG: IS3 family transposase, partial [Actinomycetia bacterium]|nr:IS3 family transposase [Actinomycetes bacterium]
MSRAASPSTGKVHGVERVCSAWGVPRSSFYHEHSSKPRADEERPPKKKRGPKPKTSDEELLELIREDIEESPFIGEGHRKVWARLYYAKKIKAAKKRVLRIMRENNLLSPHRVPQAPAREHTGRITADEPNIMWGTDGAKVFTLEEGWGWIFINVEHWNAEVLGWHVCKKGNRFAALEPISQGVLKEFGSVEAGITRGLALMLRMDSGPQYRSDDFLNQVKAWGIAPSFSFVSEPETNGVAER